MPTAKFDPLDLRHRGILLNHAALHLDGASRCIDGAGELDQHAVAGHLDDPSAMRGDGGIDNGLEASQNVFFVRTHQAALSRDIRRQNCRKLPLNPIVGQNGPRDKLPSSHVSPLDNAVGTED
jgi:hypothetical protein